MTLRIDLSEVAPRQPGEFFLLESEFENVQKKVKRLGRKAVQRGGTPAGLEVVATEICYLVRGDDERTNYCLPVLRVRASGLLFKMEGYDLVCSLEHTLAGNLVRKAPGFEHIDVTHYWHSRNHCDHCQKQRNRKDTYVLKDSEGKFLQVGRNCLADFLRKEDLATLMSIHEVGQLLGKADIWSCPEVDEERVSGEGWNSFLFGLRAVLATAYRSVRKYGYRKSGENGSTKEDVLFALEREPKEAYQAERWREAQPTHVDVEGADKILAFIEDMDDFNDYAHNLKVAVARGGVDYRSMGLVVSAAGAYFKDLGRRASKAQKPDEYFGEAKQRYEMELTLVKGTGYDTQFGWKYILIFEDKEGRTYVWKTTTGLNAEEGSKLKGKCTVKEHEEYNGRKQTILTRCSLEAVSESTLPQPAAT